MKQDTTEKNVTENFFDKAVLEDVSNVAEINSDEENFNFENNVNLKKVPTLIIPLCMRGATQAALGNNSVNSMTLDELSRAEAIARNNEYNIEEEFITK